MRFFAVQTIIRQLPGILPARFVPKNQTKMGYSVAKSTKKDLCLIFHFVRNDQLAVRFINFVLGSGPEVLQPGGTRGETTSPSDARVSAARANPFYYCFTPSACKTGHGDERVGCGTTLDFGGGEGGSSLSRSFQNWFCGSNFNPASAMYRTNAWLRSISANRAISSGS
jgi:hypothetical protein